MDPRTRNTAALVIMVLASLGASYTLAFEDGAPESWGEVFAPGFILPALGALGSTLGAAFGMRQPHKVWRENSGGNGAPPTLEELQRRARDSADRPTARGL
jgi:hypothetical protein